jgi:hypothetical protein
MGVRKGEKRNWKAGRPAIEAMKVLRRLVIVSQEQYDFMKERGDFSSGVRDLIAKEMTRARKYSRPLTHSCKLTPR